MESYDSMMLAVNEEGRLMLPENVKAILRGEARVDFAVHLNCEDEKIIATVVTSFARKEK